MQRSRTLHRLRQTLPEYERIWNVALGAGTLDLCQIGPQHGSRTLLQVYRSIHTPPLIVLFHLALDENCGWNWNNIIIVWKAGEDVSGVVHTAMHHCLFHLKQVWFGVSDSSSFFFFLNLISCPPFTPFFPFHQLQVDLHRCALQATDVLSSVMATREGRLSFILKARLFL